MMSTQATHVDSMCAPRSAPCFELCCSTWGWAVPFHNIRKVVLTATTPRGVLSMSSHTGRFVESRASVTAAMATPDMLSTGNADKDALASNPILCRCARVLGL